MRRRRGSAADGRFYVSLRTEATTSVRNQVRNATGIPLRRLRVAVELPGPWTVRLERWTQRGEWQGRTCRGTRFWAAQGDGDTLTEAVMAALVALDEAEEMGGYCVYLNRVRPPGDDALRGYPGGGVMFLAGGVAVDNVDMIGFESAQVYDDAEIDTILSGSAGVHAPRRLSVTFTSSSPAVVEDHPGDNW